MIHIDIQMIFRVLFSFVDSIIALVGIINARLISAQITRISPELQSIMFEVKAERLKRSIGECSPCLVIRLEPSKVTRTVFRSTSNVNVDEE